MLVPSSLNTHSFPAERQFKQKHVGAKI